MSEKVIGYILLLIGVLSIIFSTYNAFQVFTGKAKPIQYFTEKNSPLDLSSLSGMLGPTSGTLVSASSVNDGLNLTLHIFLISIISGAGYKLASLGIMLLRAIEVKLIKSPFETIYPKPATKP
ncbi:hypothetical protein A2397_05190 [Candidatus Amesbacteria bacterium RIFOXYB1_FULL_44_23]|uniref:Uncharacterized protein n=1 Tax=Candidatus Amesbacteria bacterium RIFOXYB1_FULL_44_23 TaxID=1797263 RepID=A0A1F4ZRP3_9BACT|nr:MAG: hypothetical protein A2397_05190 [Candidatus Amesbacteria bacterium RIFOXYB1_FULL_44_23]